MKFKYLLFGGLLALIVLFTVGSVGQFSADAAPNPNAYIAKSHARVCPGPANPGRADCHAHVVTDKSGHPQASTSPTGLSPQQLLIAYNLGTGITSPSQTIAIVNAYDHPNIFSDLNTYSATMGIPQMNSCPVSQGTPNSPCFQKVDQNGGTNYPDTDAGWALEIALDVEVAHGICQVCNILLVEATSNSYADLMTAVNRARLMGAKYISNSYGSSEFPSQTVYDSYFNHPGIVFTFSSGDNGYGPSYPAASSYVTAVGGTTLYLNADNTYNHETVWSGAGSGCSAYEPKPSFQNDTGCAQRTIADISAVADPSTGASVYNTVPYMGQTGWFQVGGTSLSAPLIAAVYAMSGGIDPSTQANSIPYTKAQYPTTLHDIQTGTNGTCSPEYLCTGVPGYDGPSGLGSPNTVNAFGSYTYVPTLTPTSTPTVTPTQIPTATPTPTLLPTTTPTPTGDPIPPTVAITYPSNGAIVSRRSTVTITAAATDNVGVQSVRFYVNNSLVCIDTTASGNTYSCNWKVPIRKNTPYILTATAIDTSSNQSSNSVSVTSN